MNRSLINISLNPATCGWLDTARPVMFRLQMLLVRVAPSLPPRLKTSWWNLVIPAGVTSLDVSVKLKAEKRFRADDHLELTVSDPKPNQVHDGNGFAVLPRAFDGTDKPSNPDGNNGGTGGNIFYGIDDHNRIWQVQPEEREDRRLYMVLDPELYKKNGMNSVLPMIQPGMICFSFIRLSTGRQQEYLLVGT